MKLINFLTSSALNLLAFRIFNITLIWAVVTTSEKDSSLLGAMIALMWIFNLISLPLAGDFLDRYNKNLVLRVSGLLSILATIIFWVNLQYINNSLLAMSLSASILAATNSITSSSINSLIPFIAEKSKVTKAVGLAATINSLQTVIGAMLGGGLIAIFGLKYTIFLVFFLYLVSLFQLFIIDFKEKFDQENKKKLHSRFTAGFRTLYFIKSERIICYTAMLTNFILTPLLMVVMPFYVIEELNGGAQILATLDSSFAFGMFLGAIILTRIDFNKYKRIYPVVFGNILIGLGIIGFSLLDSLIMKSFSLCLSGFGLTTKGVACNSIRALAVPNSHRARLESAIFFSCVITIPLGSQFFGYILNILGRGNSNIILFFMGFIIIITSLLPILSKKTLFILKQKNTQLDQAYISLYPSAFKN
jgi:MFS transporter, DHA3 family, macrolide efflux protein